MRKKLEREYDRKMSLWSKEEEDEMSPMFQSMIRARREILNHLAARSRWAQWREFNLDGD